MRLNKTWPYYNDLAVLFLRIATILNINTMNEQDISLRKLKFANHHKRLAITPRAMEDK